MQPLPEDRQANAKTLEREIADLARIGVLPDILDDALGWMAPEPRRDYRAFWGKAKEISNLFRSLRLSREDRERLWARFHGMCDTLKRIQTSERDGKQSKSRQNTERIRLTIKDAYFWAKGGKNFDDLSKARTLLADAMALMKQEILLKDDRQACWDAWKEAVQLVDARRGDISGVNYNQLDKDVADAYREAQQDDPYEALKQIKAIQREARESDLSRDQRQWLKSKLQNAWDAASLRIQERRAEKERKHREWEGRMDGKLDRLTDLHEKNERVIASLRSQVDDLESQIASAWNESWADRARGWVQEKYDKIRDIEETNRELEQKILSIRERTRG